MSPNKAPPAFLPYSTGRYSRLAGPNISPPTAPGFSPSDAADGFNGHQMHETRPVQMVNASDARWIGLFGPDGVWRPSGRPTDNYFQQLLDPLTNETTLVFWSTCFHHGYQRVAAYLPCGMGVCGWAILDPLAASPPPATFESDTFPNPFAGQPFASQGLGGQYSAGQGFATNGSGTNSTGHLTPYDLAASSYHHGNISQQPFPPCQQQQPFLNPAQPPLPIPKQVSTGPQALTTLSPYLAAKPPLSRPARQPPAQPWDNRYRKPTSLLKFKLTLSDLQVGMIVFVPPNGEYFGDHPAVIRSWKDENHVKILGCTSFSSSNSIYNKFQHITNEWTREQHMREYLLIGDGETVKSHLGLPTLPLKEGADMQKNTYVHFDVEREVKLRELRRFSRGGDLETAVISEGGMRKLEAYIAERRTLMKETAEKERRESQRRREVQREEEEVRVKREWEWVEEEEDRRRVAAEFNAVVAARWAKSKAEKAAAASPGNKKP